VAALVAARRASRPALMALEPARPSWSGVSTEGVDVHVEEPVRVRYGERRGRVECVMRSGLCACGTSTG